MYIAINGTQETHLIQKENIDFISIYQNMIYIEMKDKTCFEIDNTPSTQEQIQEILRILNQ